MPLSFDPIACILGTIAIYLAWIAYHTSTHHILQIEDFSCGWADNIDERKSGPYMECTVLNCGLPIHGLSVHFSFRKPNKCMVSLELSREPAESSVAFDKGMRCNCVVRPLQFKNFEWMGNSIQELTNPARQSAAIVIRSGDFDVQRIPLVSPRDCMWKPIDRLLLALRNSRILRNRDIPWFSRLRLRGLRNEGQLLSFVQMIGEMHATSENIKAHRAQASK